MLKFLAKFILVLVFLIYSAYSFRGAASLVNRAKHNVIKTSKKITRVKANNLRNILLTTKNTVNIRGVFTWTSVASWTTDFLAKAMKRKNNAPIYLVIDSPGGSIGAGLSFIRIVNQFKNVHTVTIFAASMGAALVEAIPGKRLIIEDGELMFHRASAGVQGQVETGELEIRIARIKKIVLFMENLNAKRIGISLIAYKRLVINEWWLFGSDAVSQKAADEVVKLTCSTKLIEKRESATVRSLFGSAEVIFSSCPLIQTPIKE